MFLHLGLLQVSVRIYSMFRFDFISSAYWSTKAEKSVFTASMSEMELFIFLNLSPVCFYCFLLEY